MNEISTFITIIGISIILIYIIMKIFAFLNIELESYGIYLTFIIFLILCYILLPSQQPTI